MNDSDRVRMILGSYTDEIPEELVHSLANRRCLALIGSGVSRRCLSRSRKPLPAWPDLLRQLILWSLAQHSIDESEASELECLILRAEYPMVGQELRDRMGDVVLPQFISDVFDPDSIVPSHVHELLALLPFRGYITTNYDNLLERAYMSVMNRQIERALSTDDNASRVVGRSPFLLNLHGDIDIPQSIILGHQDYIRLLLDREYERLLDDLSSSYALFMVGYGLNDMDISLALDRTAGSGPVPPRFLLCKRGSRNVIERKRLLDDRGIRVIEYVDYFGFHNHVDTFLEGLTVALGLESNLLRRTRPPIRRRILINYPERLHDDGYFVWNYIFRQGAITRASEAQEQQLKSLQQSLKQDLFATDYLVFLCNSESFCGEFGELLNRSIVVASKVGVQIIFLMVGVEQRPLFLGTNAASNPTFYLRNGFGEKDLEAFRTYLMEDARGGWKQQ